VNILVISGRTARHPWSNGALVAATCASLAKQGHAVTLAAQSVDDPALLACCERMHTFDSFDQTATDWPLGFAAWARRERRAIRHDVSVSFSRVAAADVWMPLEPSGAAWLARVRRSHSLVSRAIAVARHHGALRAWASDAFFVTPPIGEDAPIRRVIAVGATAAGEASRALHRARGLGERVAKVDPFGMLAAPGLSDIDTLRERTRALLGITPEQRVVLVSSPAPAGRLLDTLLDAVGAAAERTQRHAPVLLVLAKDCFALHARAAARGMASHVRIMSLTERMEAALAAADAVALPVRTARGLFEHGGSTRLAAEALAFGRPLIAVSGAPGYAMARLRSAAEDSPGLVIDTAKKEEWQRALAQLGDDSWLSRCSAAAREIGAPMTFDRFAAALETLLATVATERSEGLAL
jgi:glycosyltransferase involved in cell wall biosynthesis